MKIAYLINQYPKTSHSFIRREIAALESLGLGIIRYTLRQTTEELVDDTDKLELPRTGVVIARPISSRVIDVLMTAFSSPLCFLKAFAQAFRLGLKSDRGVGVHMIYLMEAAVVASWCKRDQINHLHVHFGTNSAAVGMLTSRLIGIPWSFTVHGPEEFDRPLGIALADKIKSAKFVIAVSSFGRSQLWRWTEFAHWKKIHVVHCGLDIDVLRGARVAIPQQRRLVCVGRLCEQKAQLLLVEAAKILKDSGIAFEIVFAGDGPMRKDIELAISAAGLEERISITGWLSGQQVRQEMENSRALVLPSFAEGLPVVIMEAMALERPVVSTMVAGIPELVVNGETGWLVPAGDVSSLVRAITEVLLQKPEVLSSMGKRARKRVLERHNAVTEAVKLKLLFEGHVI